MTPDDAARNRKMQDDVTELFDLFDAHFWGWKGILNLDSQRRSSPVQHVDVCVILPAFCGFMVSSELLKQRVRSERHVATPKAGLPHAPTRGFGAPVFGLACY